MYTCKLGGCVYTFNTGLYKGVVPAVATARKSVHGLSYVCTCHWQSWDTATLTLPHCSFAWSHTHITSPYHTANHRAGCVDKCLCMCLIALFNRASTHVLRAFYSADTGIMNFGSPLNSVTCCLMLVAGRPTSQRISSFQPQLSQTRPVTILHWNKTHNASHTQAWSPSPCSHTIPRDRASEFIVNHRAEDLHMSEWVSEW